jgi:hypothetical protein
LAEDREIARPGKGLEKPFSISPENYLHKKTYTLGRDGRVGERENEEV